jgi:6-phosphofructokinase 2
MSRILCVGLNPTIDVSCVAETIEPIHKVRTNAEKYDAGGGATNVARVISILGGAPTLAYLCGGLNGTAFETLLADFSISLRRFEMSGPVRTAYMVHEKSTGLEYKFIPEGPKISIEELNPLMEFIESYKCDYLVASGSLPPGADADAYVRLNAMAKKQEARFILDTSGQALQEALVDGGIYLAKPSKRELEVFAGHELDEQGVIEAAKALIAKGAVENLIVSLGADGALLANSDGIIQMLAKTVKARSTVGAGDSFVGAMTWWLAQEKPIVEAFHFGIAAGAAAVMTPGTDLCRADDVHRLFNERNKEIE